MEPDRISSLPSEVIDKILSRLPLREAVRTSVLSSAWRYKWAALPDLVFDDQCLPVADSQAHSAVRDKLARIIDRVLLLHSGPINKFNLSHSLLIGFADIDSWALHLSRRSVSEFVLKFGKGQPSSYKIPSCLFACQSLAHLELHHCGLKPPSTFQGFRNLRSLHLVHVTLAQAEFENLISTCPLLERLRLLDFNSLTHLHIDAPNLGYLEIKGEFSDVNLKNTYRLAVVSVCLDRRRVRPSGSSSYLLKFFVHLPPLRRLEVRSYFLKYLAVGIVPPQLPTPCIYLSYISICINFNDPKEIAVVLCILRSSPNLQELRILACHEKRTTLGTHTYCWKDDYWSCPFMQLRLVMIDGISSNPPELGFIGFLLLESPVLERMTVKPAVNGNESMELMKELLRFRRASGRAEIICMEPIEPMNCPVRFAPRSAFW